METQTVTPPTGDSVSRRGQTATFNGVARDREGYEFGDGSQITGDRGRS